MQSQMQAQLDTNRKSISHPGSIGDALENVWIDWLRTYLPSRYQVDKAIVIDATGETSDQIDVVIYDQHFTPFVFNQNGFKYIPAEGVYAVFEVKPELSKEYIKYAGGKVASVRKLQRTSANMINSGNVFPARPLTEIIGGILSSTNPISKDTTIKSHINALLDLETLDLSCAATNMVIKVDYDKIYKGTKGIAQNQLNNEIQDYYRTRVLKTIHLQKGDNVLIKFFLQLLEYLQQRIGTVAAIDLNAYLKQA